MVASLPRARTGELPDSVVARVAGHRDITMSQMREAAMSEAGNDAPRPTPAQTSRFLEVLVDRELLGEATTRENWVWSPAESVRFEALADRLALTFVLDSALAGGRMRMSRAPSAPAPNDEDLGIQVRDSTLARLGVRIDRVLIDRILPAWTRLPKPTADSSLAAQLRIMSLLPEVAAADTNRVLATSTAGEYRVHDLLGAWRRLHPAYRPRIAQAEQIEDLVRNGVYEQVLRREVDRGGWKRRPEIVSSVNRLRESMAVERLIRREAMPADAPVEALERWYRQHVARFRISTRLRVIRLVNDTREAADRSVTLLRQAAEAESLAARAHRGGVEFVAEITAASDSALFEEGMRLGAGEVVGPLPHGDTWIVARVVAVLPGRTATFEQSRADVEREWRAAETERRLRSLCDRLAGQIPVVVNPSALNAFEQDLLRMSAVPGASEH